MMTLNEPEILRLLMSSRDRIAAAAWVVARDTQAAEDIFQNVVIKSLTKNTRFDSEGALLAWAFVTARREGIDWLRRHRNESQVLDNRVLELLEQEWQTEGVAEDARTESLRQCVSALPEQSRRLLWLRYFDGHACGEVAEMLGAGIDAVYKRLSRLHQALRACVESRLAASEGSE